MSIRIDPTFDLPEGLNGLEYKDEEVEGFAAVEEIEDFEGTPLPEDEVVDDDEVSLPPQTGGGVEGVLLPPDNCTVIEQRVRIDEDGKVVIDVICEVDGSPGALQYDTKVAIR